MNEHLEQPHPSPPKHRDFIKLPVAERRRQMENTCTPELVAEYAQMSDTGPTHSIYDGLTLRQVIALHPQALGELAEWQTAAHHSLNPCPDEQHCTCVPLLQAVVSLRDAQLAALVAEIRGIAEERILPSGDGVTVEVALWAKGVLERFSALAAAHWTMLLERDQQRKEMREDHQDFLHYLAGELAQFPCCHEEGYHTHTPPMMWPELIRCIVKKASEDFYEAGQAAEKAAQQATYWADQQMPKDATGETP